VKKMVLTFVLFIALCVCAFAQKENKTAAGFGMEWNGNSPDFIAAGFAFNFDYNLPVSAVPLAVGFALTSSSNYRGTRAVEFASLFRWYFEGKAHNGLFLQAEAGFSLFPGGKNPPLPVLAGLRIGYRKSADKSFYVEPYAALGYSYLLRGGLIVGKRFK